MSSSGGLESIRFGERARSRQKGPGRSPRQRD